MLNYSFSGGLETQTDAVLLQLMAGADETLRAKAFTCFYNQHADTLHKLCQKVCRNYIYDYGSDLPEVVLHNTFMEVYQHPQEALRLLEENKDAKGEMLSADILLSAMADKELQNEVNSRDNAYVRRKVMVKNEKSLDLLVQMKKYLSDEGEDSDEKLIAIADARASDLVSLDNACHELKPVEKDLIEFIKANELPGCYLPKEEKALFLKQTGWTEKNFRKRKERVYRKLRNSVLNDRKKE